MAVPQMLWGVPPLVVDSAANRRRLTIEQVIRRYANARLSNPHTRGVMSSPPTVTAPTTTAPAAGYSRLPSSASTAADYAPYASVLGGWPIISGGFIYPINATKTIGAATGGTNSNAWQNSSRVIFYTDAPIFYIRMQTTLTAPYRLLVDGQYVDLTGWSHADSSQYYLKVDFTSAGGRKPRRIEVEMQGGTAAAGGSFGVQLFGGVYVTALDRVWAPSAGELGPRVLIYGDSFTTGPVATQVTTSMEGDGLARIAGDFLGLDDVWCSGLSGSGWIARGSGGNTVPDALGRVTDVTSWSPDVVVTALGVNDMINAGTTVNGVTINTANVQTRVGEVLAAIRAALPYVPVVVLGPWRRPADSTATAQTYETAISNGVAAMNDRFIQFRPTISTSFLTGTGREGATNGTGNTDVYTCADATHPTLAGHTYLGPRVAAEIVAGLKAMIV